MANALPKIDQVTKPAGVVLQSRDDLDLFSGLNPIVLTDTGGGSPVWQILDQPEGAAAVLSAPNAPVCNLTGASVPGTYLIQLTVDGGGLPGQIVQLVVGVQKALPAWLPDTKLRIPAFGETIQMNVKSSPAAGPNPRGWADELERWFNTVADYGFGVRVKVAGAPFGTDPFYTVNIVGALSVTDAGGGQVDVNVGSAGSGVSDLQNTGVSLPGGPFSTINMRDENIPFGGNFYFQQDAQFDDQGGNIARLYVTNARHRQLDHAPGFYSSGPAIASLAPTLNNGNPIPWTFGAIAIADVVTSVGRVLRNADIPAPLGFTIAGPVNWGLYDLVLDVADPSPAIKARTLVTTPSPCPLDMMVVDIDPTHPTGVFTLNVTGAPLNPIASWGNGSPVAIPNSNETVRLYTPAGNWVDVYVNNPPGINTFANWTVNVNFQQKEDRLTLVRAPQWEPGGGPFQWGAGSPGFRDTRQVGTVGARNLSDSVLATIDRLGGDTRLLTGVVIDSRGDALTGLEPFAGGFALIGPAGTPPTIGLGVTGGAVWYRGRRYEVKTGMNFALALPASTSLMVYARIDPSTLIATLDFQAFADPAVAIYSLVPGVNGSGPLYSAPQGVPLYFGTTDGAGNLPAAGRIDLRRDVAHLGDGTVAGRSVHSITADPDVVIPYAANPFPGRNDGVFSGEFDSICAALIWQRVQNLTNLPRTPDNLSRGGTSVDNSPLLLRIRRGTFEAYPFTLWGNVTLQGEGNPVVNVAYSGFGWVMIGSSPDFFGSTPNKAVRKVKLDGFTMLAHNVPGNLDSLLGGVIRVVAPEIDAAHPLFVTNAPSATCSDITITNMTINARRGGAVSDGDPFAGIILLASANGGFVPGCFENIRIENNRIGPSTMDVAVNNPISAFNTGINISLEPSYKRSNIRVAHNTIMARATGLISTGEGDVTVENNSFNIYYNAGAAATGASATDTSMRLIGNRFDLSNPTLHVGVFLADSPNSEVAKNQVNINGTVSANDVSIWVTGVQPHSTRIVGNVTRQGYRSIVVEGSESDGVVAENDLLCSDILTPVESVGIHLDIADGQHLDIHSNTVRGFRAGILANLDNDCYRIKIRNNDIFNIPGATDGTLDVAPGQGRGIVVLLNSTADLDRHLEIDGNRIVGFALNTGAGDSTYYTGYESYSAGITVSPQVGTGIINKGVAIRNNMVTTHLETDNLNQRLRNGVVGILTFGDYYQFEVSGNRITNLLGAVEGPTGGIWYEMKGTNPNDYSHSRDIRDNQITWISACNDTISMGVGVSEEKQLAAGIMLRGPLLPIQVTNNVIDVQSVLDNAVYLGYIHGIFMHYEGSGTIKGPKFKGNRITCLNTGNYSEGAVGSGMNLHGPTIVGSIEDMEVSGNEVDGHWQYASPGAFDIADRLSWAGIAIAHVGDESVINSSVKNNRVRIKNGAGWGRPPLHNGICIGSAEHPALGQGSHHVSVDDNEVTVFTDTTTTVPTYTAAILLVSEELGAVSRVVSNYLAVRGNRVCREDVNGNTKGILNRGFGEALFEGNIVKEFAGTNDIEDVNVGGAMVAQNIWTGNRFGSSAIPGTSALGAPPYQPTGAGTNWSGVAFV